MNSILVEVLQQPNRISSLDPVGHRLLISQARSAGLLGSLAHVLRQAGVPGQLPEPVKRHLDSAWSMSAKTAHDVNYEVGWLVKALASTSERLVLLKGAAYLQAALPPSPGRTLSDIDILAPKDNIDMVETALNISGWKAEDVDAYDVRYYRKWMHEIPPMRHTRRSSILDLHHTILPPTAAPNVNPSVLFEELVEVKPGVFTLSPRDMVIHSATHLFHEGEFHHGLRDLWDLDRMLRDFSEKDEAFWQRLVTRARQLDLMDSLFHGLRYCSKVFGTPVPAAVMAQTGSLGRKLRSPVMDFLFARAFRPSPPECRLAFTNAALSALYIRSHYLRMPLYLLIPHLARKAWMGRFARKKDEAAIHAAAKAENAAGGK